MRVRVGVLVLAMVVLPASVQGIGPDKYLHAGVSMMLAGTANGALYRTTPMPPLARMAGAFTASMTVGLAKEIRDRRIDGGDLAADAVGSLLGVLVSEYVSRSIWTAIEDDAVIVGVKGRF